VDPASSHQEPSARSVRARRELIILGLALLAGLVVLPPLIYLSGTRAFGPYAAGGLAALLGNFWRGLAAGAVGFWIVALTPYALVLITRLTFGVARRLSLASN
jgi:hypothetical protein